MSVCPRCEPQEKEHALFKRKGADLIMEKTLSLTEALCGFCFTITHLDGRVLKVESAPGDIYKHDDIKVIPGEGMPIHGSPFTKGRLFIIFKVSTAGIPLTISICKLLYQLRHDS